MRLCKRVLGDAVDAAWAERAGGEAVDDPAPTTLEHRRQHGLRTQQRAPEVDVDHPVPLVDRDVAEPVLREVPHDRGVVDEDVDAAERVDRGARHGLRRREIPHVDGHADHAGAVGLQRVGGLGGGALVDVGEHHGGAGFAECTPVGHADAAGTTGDDGDLPGQVEELRGVHRARPFCRP